MHGMFLARMARIKVFSILIVLVVRHGEGVKLPQREGAAERAVGDNGRLN